MSANRRGGRQPARTSSIPSPRHDNQAGNGFTASAPPVPRGAVVSPHRRLLARPADQSELHAASLHGGGVDGLLQAWLRTVSAWLNCIDDHDEDSASSIVRFSARQRVAVGKLDEYSKSSISGAMQDCKTSLERWRDTKQAQSWADFVRSVADLETLIAAAILTRENSSLPLASDHQRLPKLESCTESSAGETSVPRQSPDFSGRNSKWKHLHEWLWNTAEIRYESGEPEWLAAIEKYRATFAGQKVGRDSKYTMPKREQLKTVRDCLRQLLKRQGFR
jgi:hypothetical protein